MKKYILMISLILLIILLFCSCTQCGKESEEASSLANSQEELSLSASDESSSLEIDDDSVSSEAVIEEYDSWDVPILEPEDLLEQAALVVKGKVKSKSEPFVVEEPSGRYSVLTDTYFEIEDVLRGIPYNDKEIIIRLKEGVVGNLSGDNPYIPELSVSKEYVLFLYKPNIGGGHSTKGDSYFVVGDNQGTYEREGEDENFYVNQYAIKFGNFANLDFEKTRVTTEEYNINRRALNCAGLKTALKEYNELVPVNENAFRDEMIRAREANYESGFFSKEEYERYKKEDETYARILSDDELKRVVEGQPPKEEGIEEDIS